MSYKPKCDRCEHYKSCAIQKRLAELYQELWNINREKCGRTDGFVDGHYVKDIADIPSADVVEVVRCGNCEHYEDDYCRVLDTLIEPTNDCSFGVDMRGNDK